LTAIGEQKLRTKRTIRAPTTRSRRKSNEPGISDALLADLKELEKVLFGGRPGPRPKLEENNDASRNDERARKTPIGRATNLFARKMINLCGCEAGPTAPVCYDSYM
jgi:hypothetical protein